MQKKLVYFLFSWSLLWSVFRIFFFDNQPTWYRWILLGVQVNRNMRLTSKQRLERKFYSHYKSTMLMQSLRDKKEYAFDLECYRKVVPEVRLYSSPPLCLHPHIVSSRNLKGNCPCVLCPWLFSRKTSILIIGLDLPKKRPGTRSSRPTFLSGWTKTPAARSKFLEFQYFSFMI